MWPLSLLRFNFEKILEIKIFIEMKKNLKIEIEVSAKTLENAQMLMMDIWVS